MSGVDKIKDLLGLGGGTSSGAVEKASSEASTGDVDETASTRRREGLVRWGMPVVAVGVLAVTGMVTSGVNSDRSSTLSSQQNQITDLKNQINVANVARQDKANQVNSQISGISSERQTGDDAAIRDLMSKVTTWSSYAEYNANRDAIMRKYKVDEKSSFMTSFMPKINSIKDNSGTSFNKIDTNGLNMRMTNFTSSVTKVAGTKYTYIGVATIQTTSTVTKGNTTTYTFVEYTTDAAHDLTDLKGYPVGKNPSTTGSLTKTYG